MADVDMTDAPSASTAASATKKERKGGEVEPKTDGKKRFEVKKVSRVPQHRGNWATQKGTTC